MIKTFTLIDLAIVIIFSIISIVYGTNFTKKSTKFRKTNRFYLYMIPFVILLLFTLANIGIIKTNSKYYWLASIVVFIFLQSLAIIESNHRLLIYHKKINKFYVLAVKKHQKADKSLLKKYKKFLEDNNISTKKMSNKEIIKTYKSLQKK